MGRSLPAGDLPPAGDAGADEVALVLPVLVVLDDLGQLGARSDEAHLAREDVEELGELIQAGFAQEAAEFGDAGVVLDLVAEFAVLVAEELELLAVGIELHGAELVDGEGCAAAADAGLLEDGGSGGVAADGDGDQGKERAEEGQQDERADEVDQAFAGGEIDQARGADVRQGSQEGDPGVGRGVAPERDDGAGGSLAGLDDLQLRCGR